MKKLLVMVVLAVGCSAPKPEPVPVVVPAFGNPDVEFRAIEELRRRSWEAHRDGRFEESERIHREFKARSDTFDKKHPHWGM